MYHKTLDTNIEEGIATITLNRPEKLNAINLEMLESLTKITEEIDKNDDVKVVVLNGARRAFCAGADVDLVSSSLQGKSTEHIIEQNQKLGRE